MKNSMVTISLITMLILLGVLFATAVIGKDAPDKSVEERIAELQAERIETLKGAIRDYEVMYRSGSVGMERLIAARSNLIEARLELASTNAERLALLKEHFDLAKHGEEVAERRFKDGSASHVDYLQAKATRLQREIALLRGNSD